MYELKIIYMCLGVLFPTGDQNQTFLVWQIDVQMHVVLFHNVFFNHTPDTFCQFQSRSFHFIISSMQLNEGLCMNEAGTIYVAL